ncbi:MAG: ABC transporter substrate-binding protein [Fimbriimonadaceae bacterium]|nr:ABC transporter substrate-binding protein [Fimbriimonadaceae bacterium]
MRRTLTPLLALGAIGLGLVGCSAPAETPAPAGETTSSAAPEGGKTFKIGVSIPAATHGWTGGVVYWANEESKKHPGFEFNIQTADKPEDQINDLETMMTQGVDALVVLATESAPLTPIAKQIRDKGILLVSVDRGFTEPVAHAFVQGDNKAFGRMAAEYMAEKLGGKGDIVILEGLPSTVNTDRVEAFRAEIAKSPNIRILESQPGNWNRQKSLEVMQVMLTKHPKIDAIWSSDDDMSEGVEQALKEAGRAEGIWMLGGGGKKEIIKRIMDGDPLYPATVTYPPSMITDGIRTAVELLKEGRKPETQETRLVELKLITPETAKDNYFPDATY